jgi:hypothetical protein
LQKEITNGKLTGCMSGCLPKRHDVWKRAVEDGCVGQRGRLFKIRNARSELK